MTAAALLTFAAAWALLVILPGPDTALTVKHAVMAGRRDGTLTALGSCTALTVHVTAAGLGISAIIAQSATAFSVIKYAGAAYLIFLGLRLLLARDGGAVDADEEAPVRRRGNPYLQGMATGMLNPKSAIFFLSFFPQFIDPDAAAAPQLLALGAITIAVAGLWLAILIAVSGQLRRAAQRPRVRQLFERLTGTALVVLGARLAATTK